MTDLLEEDRPDEFEKDKFALVALLRDMCENGRRLIEDNEKRGLGFTSPALRMKYSVKRTEEFLLNESGRNRSL